MRKRNATNKQQLLNPSLLINVEDEKEVKIDMAEIQVTKKIPNYSALQATSTTTRTSYIPNLRASIQNAVNDIDKLIKKNNPTDTNNNKNEPNGENNEGEYSDSYSYSYSSENEEKTENAADPEVNEMKNAFQQLFEKFGTYEEKGTSHIDKKISEATAEYMKVTEDIKTIEATIGTRASTIMWSLKQFFTELIDFIDKSSELGNFSQQVNPKYLSLDYALDLFRSIQKLDPELYLKVNFPDTVVDIFEFYAIIETSDFSFGQNRPLIDLPWIRAGWKWTDIEGNPDTVPKVFEQSCVPLLINKLKTESLINEAMFRFAFLHLIEMSDYCNHPNVIDTQLFPVLKGRLESAFGTGKIPYEIYNQMMIDFGFKKPKNWEGI